MGASLTMIDRHYGHLARDGREHAIRLLDELTRDAKAAVDVCVDVRWTPQPPIVAASRQRKHGAEQAGTRKPSNGLEPLTPSLPWRCSTN